MEVLEIGCLAREALAAAGAARVGAVFEHSFYIATPRQWMCVGSASMGSGPMNVRCAACGPDWRASDLRVNDGVHIDPPCVHVRPGLALCFAGAPTWRPPPAPEPSRKRLRDGLAALEAVVDGRAPSEGLAALLGRPRSGAQLPPVAAAAREPSARLRERLRAAFASGETPAPRDLGCLESLLGLGPGLTPSGDDFIVGALVALHLLGCGELRDALWRSLRALAPESTNEISGAHLSAAARGFASAALHDILNDVLAGNADRLDARIRAIDAIGHTSGWDALAGAVAVLHAWSDASRQKGTNPFFARGYVG